MRAQRLGRQEMFVPLTHPPGDAQSDFGEALVVNPSRVEQKAHYLVVDLPHIDDGFVQPIPPETTEAFCAGHNAAFDYFGGEPRRIVYDNTLLAVSSEILSDGTRSADAGLQRAPVALLIRRSLRTPGQVQRQRQGGRAGRVRPPQTPSCRSPGDSQLGRVRTPASRASAMSVPGARFTPAHRDDRGAVRARPHSAVAVTAGPVRRLRLSPDAGHVVVAGALPTQQLGRGPTAYGHRAVLVQGYVDEVVIVCGSEEMRPASA